MQRHRRIIGIISHLVLVQWILLGSGLLCAPHAPMSRLSAGDEMSAVTSGAVGEHGCDMLAKGSCRADQTPTGGCAAMTSCVSGAAPSSELAFVSTHRPLATAIAAIIDEPLNRSSRPESPPPRA